MLKKKSTIDMRTVRQQKQRDLIDQEVLRLRREVNGMKKTLELLTSALQINKAVDDEGIPLDTRS